ncbi:hypothetical protein [Variovorax ginsengisoli]|uniref:Uncharacterized protein n=1 Tax=Variovorax ginsengisoli TaxID=363844 RepID=A0ABT8S5Y5_9BURK|nr:hypothetical protein [Variovorax ginsengisoli]MDN8615158.1 hypothetical protein [Variovorax ginsengisoli]MDO1534328.1 hypothetical protein [Variovorax ginsengisoli]
MQTPSNLSSRNSLFGFGILRRPHRVQPSPAVSTVAAFDIPAPFTQEQAEWILALHKLGVRDRSRATQVLHDWTPARCSPAQATCIEALLDLDAQDLHDTLADAMEDCDLCGRLADDAQRSLRSSCLKVGRAADLAAASVRSR